MCRDLLRHLLLFVTLGITGIAMGQSHGLTFQALILNRPDNNTEIPGVDVPGGSYLSDQQLDIRFTIHNEDGDIDYQEEHTTTTDRYGLISVIIGDGTMTAESPDVFKEISWDGTPKELVVEVNIPEPFGFGMFVEFSRQKLVFAPYAYHRNITATGTMDIDGATNLNSSLSVNNGSPTLLTGTLTVDGCVYLHDCLVVDGTTDLNNGLNVNYNTPTDLSGTLNVDGATTMNSTLDVDGATTLNLTLDVDGATTLNSTLDVDGSTTLNSTLDVDGATTLHNTLNVAGATTINNTLTVAGNTTLQSDLFVEGSAEIGESLRLGRTADLGQLQVNTDGYANETTTLKARQGDISILGAESADGTARALVWDDGLIEMFPGTRQVRIDGQASGGATNNTGSYPLYVKGAQQGIAVKLNTSAVNSGNNFLYFSDNSYIRGSVQGQTLSELHNSFEYIWFNSMAVLDEAFILAEGVACGAQLDLGEAGVMAANAILILAQWAEEFYHMETEVGVVYQSNSADYAEWLQRDAGVEDLAPGTIVGVNGGRISTMTEGARQLMVVSTAPLVLGNTPPAGEEANYEKVAFLGQVPLQVRGVVNVGDYVLASGLNDGTGIGKAPADMTLEDYDRIVGVAWSRALFPNGTSQVNTAVGMNQGAINDQLKRQKQELDALKGTMQELLSYLRAKDPSFPVDLPGTAAQPAAAPPAVAAAPARTPVVRDRKEVEALLRSHPEILERTLAGARSLLAAKGYPVDEEPLAQCFNTEAFFARLNRSAPVPDRTPRPVVPDVPRSDQRIR
ncbi:MAG: hypothetical protein IPM49_05925 [Flavobacteriales bacterium]|nr:hypothetical protein [Flavobacteriales bacterium]